MLESAWLFVGVLGIVATGAAVITRDDAIAIVAGVTGFVVWGVWTYGALDVEVANGATVYNFSMPAVAFLGIALALVPGYVALTGPVDIVGRARDGRVDEM